MEYYERLHSISKSSQPTVRFMNTQDKIEKEKLFRPKEGNLDALFWKSK